MQTIAVVNQKGGVGKTATSVNLAAGLTRAGRRCLLIDLDPQGNASASLGIDQAEKTISAVFTAGAALGSVINTAGPVAVVPADIELASTELTLTARIAREYVLRDALADFAGLNACEYDAVLIDCPPSLSLLTLNAMAAADHLIVPVQCEPLALKGVAALMDTLQLVRKSINAKLGVAAVVPTLCKRRKVDGEVIGFLGDYFGAAMSGVNIRQCVAISEAAGAGKSVFDYAPGSPAAEDYRNLTAELIERVMI